MYLYQISIAIRNKLTYSYKFNNIQYSYMSNFVISIIYLQTEAIKS